MVFVLLLIVAFAVILLIVHATASKTTRDRDQLKLLLRNIAEPVYVKDRLCSIRVRWMTSLEFVIRAEDERTNRMRRSGELVELQTGDHAFDRRMYVECDDTRLGKWLREDAEARKLISALVGTDRSVELRKGWLALASINLKGSNAEIRELAKRLQELAPRIPRTAGIDPASMPRAERVALVNTLSWMVLVAGLVVVAYEMVDVNMNPFPQHVRLWPLLLAAAVPGAALATWAYLAALRAVRETSHAPRLATELFVKVWVPVVGVTLIAAHQFNLKAFAHEERTETSRVTDVGSKKHRRSRSYHFNLPALDGGQVPAARYDSSAQINDTLRVGQAVRVSWRDGRLASQILTRAPEPLPEAASDEVRPP